VLISLPAFLNVSSSNQSSGCGIYKLDKYNKMMEAVLPSPTYQIERNKPMPDKLHAFLQKQLLLLIQWEYKTTYEVLPELNILFEEEKRILDLVLYKKSTLDFTKNETYVKEIPDGAIEILSGKQAMEELMYKLELYFAAGVKSYWLVSPLLRSIYVFHTPDESQPFGRHDVLKDEVLGIELDLNEVFEGM
jgi:Uma2 family endonuclease